jgi:hypothetical protein
MARFKGRSWCPRSGSGARGLRGATRPAKNPRKVANRASRGGTARPSAPLLTFGFSSERRSTHHRDRPYKADVGGSTPSAPTRSEAVFGGPAASLPTGMGSLPHRPPLPSQLPAVAPSHRLTVHHIAVRARPGDSGVDVVIRPLLAAARQNAAMRGDVAMSVAGEGEVCRMP